MMILTKLIGNQMIHLMIHLMKLLADAEEALANEPEINGVKSLNFR